MDNTGDFNPIFAGQRWISISFYCSVYFILLLFIFLSFFDHPSADDLILNYVVKNEGWWPAWVSFYQHGNGRYFSNMMLFALSGSDFVLHHYYVIPVTLILITIAAIYFLLKQVNRFLLVNPLNKYMPIIMAPAFFVGYILLIPDPATAFYWMSGAIVYESAVILLLLLSGVMIRFWFAQHNRGFYGFVLSLLIILACGCHELAVVFLFMTLFMLIIISFRDKQKFKWVLYLLMLVIAAGSFILFSPGNLTRSGSYGDGKGIGYSLFASLFQIIKMIVGLLQKPLSIAYCIFLFYLIATEKVRFVSFPYQKIKASTIAYFILLTVSLEYFLPIWATGNSLPERAVNLIIFQLACMVSVLLIWYGVKNISVNSFVRLSPKGIRPVYVIFIAIFMLSDRNCINAVKSVFSGAIYHKIMTGRRQQIAAARMKGQHKVVLKPYEEDWDNYVTKHIGRKYQRPFRKVVPYYPPAIFFSDDLKDTAWVTSYAEFYRIDTIEVGSRNNIRCGLLPEEK